MPDPLCRKPTTSLTRYVRLRSTNRCVATSAFADITVDELAIVRSQLELS